MDRAALRLSLVVELEAESAMEERRTQRRCHGFQRLAGGEAALRDLYETGRGVEQDDAAGLSWYRRAAERGSASAQNRLGVMYRDGVGVAGDDEVATGWSCGRSGGRWHGGGLGRSVCVGFWRAARRGFFAESRSVWLHRTPVPTRVCFPDEVRISRAEVHDRTLSLAK